MPVLHINITPIGAVRATRMQVVSGKNKAYLRYDAYKNQIRAAFNELGHHKLDGAVRINSMVFGLPIPKYAAKSVKSGQIHTMKPDADNLIKGVMDALNGYAWEDDNRVYEVRHLVKTYDATPFLLIDYEEVGPLPDFQLKAIENAKKAREKKNGDTSKGSNDVGGTIRARPRHSGATTRKTKRRRIRETSR